MTATLLPSAAAVTVSWLKNNADLAAIHGGRVGTKLNATLPAVRVQRIGGSPDEVWEDYPVLQLECWSADEATAERLALTIVAVLPTIRGVYASGRVYTYAVETGPYWAPDDPALSSNSRYILTVRLFTATT